MEQVSQSIAKYNNIRALVICEMRTPNQMRELRIHGQLN
jgi:hypothetical protein